MPFADVNPRTGRVGVLYVDQGEEGRDLYDLTLATGRPGSSFNRARVTTAPSHPNDSLWYRQQSADPIGSGAPPCVTCAQWTGDYVGFEYARDGSRNMVWTDMRRPLGLSGSGLEGLIGPPPDGFTEDAFFARKP